jgi:hypothetical protein
VRRVQRGRIGLAVDGDGAGRHGRSRLWRAVTPAGALGPDNVVVRDKLANSVVALTQPGD